LTGFSDHTAQGILNHITGKSAIFTEPTAYVALFTGVGTDAGSGFTEVSGSGYTRATTAAADWNSATGTGPSTISNANAITFPTSSGSWGTIIAFGLYDAPSGGNLLAWDYMGSFPWQPATVAIGSPGVITAPAHGLSVGNSCVFSTEYGGTAPSFSASNFTGLLVVAHAATNTFDVTNATVPVNTSSVGNGSIRQVLPATIGSSATPAFTSGAFTITCA
jgi:hypothetical protein